MTRITTALSGALVSLVFASCGGGGGGSDAASTLVFAGGDRSIDASVPVSITASAAQGAGVTAFAWAQTAGADVPLSGLASASIDFVAPPFSSTLEFEVTGRRSDGSVAGRDRVVVQVLASRPRLTAPLLSTIQVRGGGADRAMAAALHPATRRLFVIDAVGGDVVCYDVTNPSSPSFAGSIGPPEPTLGFVPGPPLAIAAGDDGAVAITWSGQTPEFPGRLVLVDPLTLSELASVSTTGANPVGLDVSADGSLIAIACAANPPFVGGGDGRGYITLVRVPPGGAGAIEVHRDVSPIVLSAFDGDKVALEQAGVRFFTGTQNVSLELTPRSVAISPDNTCVWASCPENDALLVIDPIAELVTEIVPLEDRLFDSLEGGIAPTAERWSWSLVPDALTTAAGDVVGFGGVTGISAVELLPGGDLGLSVVTGAGPTAGVVSDRDGDGALDLTFLDPEHVQTISRVIVARTSGALSDGGQVPLRTSGGAAVVGVPSLFNASPGLAGHDEPGVDLDGNPVPPSSFGARFGGATTASTSGLWLGDSRRAGLWHFSAAGFLQARYVPNGTPSSLGTPTLPAVYATRRASLQHPVGRRFGGFGGVAYHPGRDTIFAVTRLPLDNPDDALDQTSRASRIARLLELRTTDGVPVGEFVVVLDGVDHALEGLAFGSGPAFDGALALLEAGPDASSFRGVQRLDLTGATNLQNLSAGDYATVSAALESTAPSALANLVVPVLPVTKTLRVDLTAAGLGGGGRPSALAFAGERLVVAFDDGAGLDDASVASSTGRLVDQGAARGSIAVLELSVAGIDASTGSGFNPSALPIRGLSGPLDLAAWQDGGRLRLALANGGLARVVPHSAGGTPIDEREFLGGLVLDTSVFPNAFVLQTPEVAGDLRVSSVAADLNGDGLVDRLQAFGARSIAVRDAAGGLLWSSGVELESRAHALRPARVEEAAADYGIRPSSLAVMKVGGQNVLVAGLRGAGVAALFELSNASAPLLSGFTGSYEDPVDVDAAELGVPVVAITDRATGRIELRRVQRL